MVGILPRHAYTRTTNRASARIVAADAKFLQLLALPPVLLIALCFWLDATWEQQDPFLNGQSATSSALTSNGGLSKFGQHTLDGGGSPRQTLHRLNLLISERADMEARNTSGATAATWTYREHADAAFSEDMPSLLEAGAAKSSSNAPAENSSALNSTDRQGLAIITTTADPVPWILRWAEYHRKIGVDMFYVFVDGGTAASPTAAERLTAGRPWIRVFQPGQDQRLKDEQAASAIWRAPWLRNYMHKPCNHELFVMQSLNMETGLKAAKADGMAWVAHIDVDELLYPAGAPSSFAVPEILASLPETIESVVIPNYEAVPERGDVSDPFRQVTLFKRNSHHVNHTVYKQYYRKVARGNPNYFLAYANGKSIAKVKETIRPNGAHRFAYTDHNITEVTHPSMAVLHYPYNRFSDLRGRRDRCDCLPTLEDAARCFMLQFDRLAFVQSSLLDDQELLVWYQEHVVFGNRTAADELCHEGLFERIQLPQMMVEPLSEAE